MKRFFTLVLILLTIFSSCKNRDFKDYIEQGFSKPIVEDVSFSKSNIGDGNKLYVPSEEDIDVQFTIKNRYAKELTGSLQFDEAKKALFSTEPFIKDLTPTKMIVAFNFKEDAEPKAVNSFLGELVEVTASIFEKKTGRYLSSQKVKLGCNTPPLPIKDSDIQYDAPNDKFIVTLPQEIRKHKDLKEVRFTLSDSLGNVAREAKVVSIALASEQGQAYTLEIKGSENWQLDPPVGQRRLKAIVYDKAGLKSGEKEGKPTRLFNAITLDPPNQSVVCSELKTGVPVPKIRELEEFANGDGWKNDSTYTVTYSSPGFTYYENESGGKKTGYLKNESASEGASYTVTVKLEQGGILVNTRSTTYTISVNGDDTTELDEGAIKVEDVTTYNDEEQRLKFQPNSINFTTSSTTEVGKLEIPYTGSETKLKVYIKAISEKCKGEDVGGSGTKWSPQHEKTYEITIPEASSSAEHIKFTITAPDEHTSKSYDIEFTRGESVKVTLEFQNKPILTGSKNIATGKVLWEAYREKTIEYNPDNASTNNKMEITVRKDADVKFTITPIEGKGVKVKECSSNIGHNTTSVIPNGCEGLVLNASEDFTLTVLLRPEASVKWKNYQAPTPTYHPGYTGGKINYKSPDGTKTNFNLTGKDQGRAVKSGDPATFELVGFNAGTHFVEKWIVKHGDVTDEVTSNGDNYELEASNSTLKIVKVEGEYEVEVVVKKFCKVVVNIGQYNGNDFGIFTDTEHKYQITATNTATSLDLTRDENTPTNTYTFSKIKPNTTIKFASSKNDPTIYGFVKWEYKKVSGRYSSSPNGEITETIVEDMNVRLVLKKQEYSLTVNFKEVKTGYPHLYTLTATDITDSPTGMSLIPKAGVTSDVYTYNVTSGRKIKLTITNGAQIRYAIKKWQSGTTDLPASDSNHTAEIIMDGNKNIDILLIPQYKFKIIHEEEADSGKMEIKTGDDGSTLVATVMKGTNSSKVTKAIEGDVYFKVNGLDPKDMVVSYRNGASEFTQLLDENTGLWKEGTEKVDLRPGDTFEVVIARFHRINISVRDYANDSELYGGDEFILKVSKQAGVGRLFPYFKGDPPGTLGITKNMMASGYCTVYVSKNVTLQFEMENLNEQKEIGEWKGTLVDSAGSTKFNEEPTNPDLTKGKTSSDQYTSPSGYQNDAFTLNACIRDKTAVLTVQSLEYVNGVEGLNTHDANIAVGITPTGLSQFILRGNEEDYKKRIKVGIKVKLKASRNSTSDYYFAYWKKGSDENYAMSQEFNMPDADCSIKAYWSKTFIVKMHEMLEEDVKDWPSDKPFGLTQVKLLKGSVVITKEGEDDNILQNNVEGTLIPVYGSVSNLDQMIKNIDKIRLRLKLSNANVRDVIYKYNFGDKDGDKYQSWNYNNYTDEFTINKTTLESAVLNVWLKDIKLYD
ncbi:MAG: hypothetical protein ACTTIZ_08175 [Treponema sp.]